MSDVTDPSPPSDNVSPKSPSSADDGLGEARGVAELLIGALAGSTLLPFVQAMASKAGEDVYTRIRHRLSRRGQKRVEREIRDAGTITLVASDARVVLRIPATLDPLDAARLGRVKAPRNRTDWYLVRWDEDRRNWSVVDCAEPPEGTETADQAH